MNFGGGAVVCLGGLGLGWLDVVGALRARDVKDDLDGLLVFVFLDGGHGVEKLTGDVGEDGGAPGGDFVLGEEEQEAREKGVDLDGIGEVIQAGGEGRGDVDFCGRGLVSAAQTGLGIGGRDAATSARDGAVTASIAAVRAKQQIGIAGLRLGLGIGLGHGCLSFVV